MSESTKGGNVILRSVEAPDSVRSGESFTVEAVVSNGALVITGWDSDLCKGHGEAEDGGYELQVVFEGPDGQTHTDGPNCHSTTTDGTRDLTYTATFTAPDYGDEAAVSAYVKLPNSGKRTDAIETRVAITDEEPEEPESRDTSGNNWLPGGGGGGDPGGGGGPLSQINNMVTLIIVVMLIGAVMQSGVLGGASS